MALAADRAQRIKAMGGAGVPDLANASFGTFGGAVNATKHVADDNRERLGPRDLPIIDEASTLGTSERTIS